MQRRRLVKTKKLARKTRKFVTEIYRSEPFQQAPMKERQEIDVIIHDIGNDDCITHIRSYPAEKEVP